MQDKCILIYDSHDDICEICRLILEKDYRVETYTDCENLFENIERVKPDIILMDIWMPNTDGETVVKALSENDATTGIPVILFSTASDIDRLSKRVNAAGYIKKPFTISTLRETVGKHTRQN